MEQHRLTLQVDGEWKWFADITASRYQLAFREACLRIPPEHCDKPIRLERIAPATEAPPNN